MDIKKAFNKPKIVAVCGDVNSAKSNLLYFFVSEISKRFKSNIFSYGLKIDLKCVTEIYSVDELERIKDSIIIVDEFYSLFNLDDRKQKRMIENTFRLINHNNNILLLAGIQENFKKFVSAKVDLWFFKECRLSDFINGSRAKAVITNYRGIEKGSAVLSIEKNNCLFFDGKSYGWFSVPYLRRFDTKKGNVKILGKKKCKK